MGLIYLLSITFSIQDPMSLLDPNATFGGTAAVAQVQARLIDNDDPHSCVSFCNLYLHTCQVVSDVAAARFPDNERAMRV